MTHSMVLVMNLERWMIALYIYEMIGLMTRIEETMNNIRATPKISEVCVM